MVKPLKLYGEMHRFIPAIASEQGVTIDEMVVNHRARKYGSSKYGISRTIRVILDLLTVKFLLSYSTRPVQIFGLIGLVMGGAGALITGYLAWVRLFGDQSIANRPLLLLADEPTGNLDPTSAARVHEELLRLIRDEGLAALVATHNLELAAGMSRIVRLERGRLISGEPA